MYEISGTYGLSEEHMMTLEKELENELAKADELLKAVASAKPIPPKYPHYGHLGDVQWFNEKLREIIETFGRREVR